MEEQNLYEKLEIRRRRVAYCKKSTKFISINIALGLLMMIYSVVGALVFQKLETTNEKEQCTVSMNKYYPMENQTAHDLLSMSNSYIPGTGGEYEDELIAIQQVMVEFRRKVLELRYDGLNCTHLGEPNGPPYKWSFSGSLLFAVTVFTTVGYGNIAPKTFWGRLVSIVYAFIGIPLMLFFLASVGSVMADVFRFVYSRICCCGCFDDKRSVTSESKQNLTEHQSNYEEDLEEEEEHDDLSVPLTITLSVLAVYLFMGSILFGTWEKWSMLQSAYYCFVTISTIGFGDVVPGTDDMNSTTGQLTMIGAAVYLIFGMAIMSMSFNLIQEDMVGKFLWISEKLGLSKKDEEEEDYADERNPSSIPRDQPIKRSITDEIATSEAQSMTKMAETVISQPTKK